MDRGGELATGLSEQMLRNWVNRSKADKPVADPMNVTALEVEVSKLRRELAEDRMECDILKTAMAYQATGPWRGVR